MIAMAILFIMVILISRILTGGSILISNSKKHLGVDAKAREIFTRFEYDIKKMPVRMDLDVAISDKNNAIFFVSESSGFFRGKSSKQSTATLVGYRLNKDLELERLGKSLSWDQIPFLTYKELTPSTNSTPIIQSTFFGIWGNAIGTPPEYNNGKDSDYHILAEGVLKFFIYFKLKDGSFTTSLESHPPQSILNDVTTIIITTALLDDESLRHVKHPSVLSSLLTPPPFGKLDVNSLPAKTWQESIDHPVRLMGAIPPEILSRIRIYQRSFTLNKS